MKQITKISEDLLGQILISPGYRGSITRVNIKHQVIQCGDEKMYTLDFIQKHCFVVNKIDNPEYFL